MFMLICWVWTNAWNVRVYKLRLLLLFLLWRERKSSIRCWKMSLFRHSTQHIQTMHGKITSSHICSTWLQCKFKHRALCVNSTHSHKNAFRHYDHFYKHSNFSLFSSPISLFRVFIFSFFHRSNRNATLFHFTSTNSIEIVCFAWVISMRVISISYLSFVDIIWNLRDSSVMFFVWFL